MHKPGGMKLVAIIVGSLIAVAVLVFGGFLLVGRFSRASDAAPTDVTVSSITQNSATVTWTSGAAVEGVVEYGTSPSALGLFAVEVEPTTSHSVDLTLLSPETTYYFQVKVADKTFTNGGVPWSFSTSGASASEPLVTPTSAATPTTVVEPTAATPAVSACTETDCEKMKAKFGKGCTTQDYFQCVRKLTPTP